jgi:hypothetical protein
MKFVDIDKLKARLSAGRFDLDEVADLAAEALAASESLQRELEEARKPSFSERLSAAQTPMEHTIEDARRYEWLRDNWRNVQIGFNGMLVDALALETRPDVRCEMPDIAGFDSAIDAARHQKS